MNGPDRGTRPGPRQLHGLAAAFPPSADAGAVLDDLCEQGHFADIDLHFAALIAELDGGDGPELALAAALASAWTRDGHACIELPEVAGRHWPRAGALQLPTLDRWLEVLDASPVVAGPEHPQERPLVLDGEGRLYLERLWVAERVVATGLRELAGDVASVSERIGAARGLPSGPRSGSQPGREGDGSALVETGNGSGGWRRTGSAPGDAGLGPDEFEDALARLFPGTTPGDPVRVAARIAVCHRLCVVSGGPGTGKTSIAAGIVALLVKYGLAAPGRIALAAPTGKAAARLQEAVRGRHRELVSLAPALEGHEAQATTVHRWLLQRGDGRGRRPIDALILDEGSMVDLTLMARVLAALPAGARLVVLGDASQLASVQPGAVFADLCRAGIDAGVHRSEPSGGPETGTEAGTRGSEPSGAVETGTEVGTHGSEPSGAAETGTEAGTRTKPPEPAPSPRTSCVVELVRNWRFDASGGIGRLAAAVERGDACAAVAALRDPSDGAIELRALPDAGRFEQLATDFADEWFAPVVREIRALRGPGEGGRPLSAFRVLCAHRIGPFGAERFNRSVERRLRALGLVRGTDTFYPGRPILVTRNDPRTGLSNGDTGVVLRDADDRVRVWFPELEDTGGRPRLVAPARLPPHESFFAVTVHRAQGSEYDEVAVVLGPAESRVATRELLYTAVTRARRRVVVHGSEASVEAAVERATERSSGLRDALSSRPLTRRQSTLGTIA